MNGQQWWHELYRNHTGAMWQQGNAREKKDTMGTGFALHRAIPRKNLRMLGAPRSMFSPSASAYMKDALAAHRQRNYALAQHIAQKLLPDGVVPDEEKPRVDHFHKSVKMLKESIEHDLTFTEGLLAKQNFLLASMELSQLQMVVSPDDPRLKAIASAVESKRDQIPSREELRSQRMRENLQANGASKQALKEAFQNEVANTITLIKDSAEHQGPKGARRGTHYPKFAKQELSQWRMQMMPPTDEFPRVWEQAGFDDSKWKAATLVKKWKGQNFALLRTDFDVINPNALRALRVRMMCRGKSNLTMYLNGEVVAKAAEAPGSITFDLPPSALGLLKRGSNTLAVSAQGGHGSHGFSIRLDGIQGDRPKGANFVPDPSPNASTVNERKKPEASKTPPVLKTPHEEIHYMLAQLKKAQPQIKVGERLFPGMDVHDYMAKFYEDHRSKVPTTEVFLEKIAFRAY